MSDKISLREYTDARFEAQNQAVQAALASAEKAVEKANAASDKRFDSVNEFRGQLKDYTSTLLTRAEYEAQHSALVEKVNALSLRAESMASERRGAATAQAAVFAIVTLILGVMSVWSLLR